MIPTRRHDFSTRLMQAILGVSCYLLFILPYCRRIRGRVPARATRCLLVCNHVSLLDTLFIGGLFWSRRALPILVLGDRETWRASRLKRLLAWRLGFLIERGGIVRERIEELRAFARCSRDFHLLVFPEGTRGDGVNLGPLQPGVYFVAQEAKIPIVPMRLSGMQRVSRKGDRFHPLGGLRKVEIEFGEPFAPEDYLKLRREDFLRELAARMEALGRGAEGAGRA